ncbi:hypothetical protein SUDANB21_00855 [Streptomyces sp. enrichment culture]
MSTACPRRPLLERPEPRTRAAPGPPALLLEQRLLLAFVPLAHPLVAQAHDHRGGRRRHAHKRQSVVGLAQHDLSEQAPAVVIGQVARARAAVSCRRHRSARTTAPTGGIITSVARVSVMTSRRPIRSRPATARRSPSASLAPSLSWRRFASPRIGTHPRWGVGHGELGDPADGGVPIRVPAGYRPCSRHRCERVPHRSGTPQSETGDASPGDQRPQDPVTWAGHGPQPTRYTLCTEGPARYAVRALPRPPCFAGRRQEMLDGATCTPARPWFNRRIRPRAGSGHLPPPARSAGCRARSGTRRTA